MPGIAVALGQAREPSSTLGLQSLCPENPGLEEAEGLWDAAGSSLEERAPELGRFTGRICCGYCCCCCCSWEDLAGFVRLFTGMGCIRWCRGARGPEGCLWCCTRSPERSECIAPDEESWVQLRIGARCHHARWHVSTLVYHNSDRAGHSYGILQNTITFCVIAFKSRVKIHL